jgi:hypothetical protein
VHAERVRLVARIRKMHLRQQRFKIEPTT